MRYAAYGAPLVLTEVAVPTPGPNEVLLRVRRSSVNPVDWKIHSGKIRLFVPQTMPVIPGFDVAGEIAALGPGVTGWTVGQRAHARMAKTGASAPYATVTLDVLAPIPEGMDDDTAAGLPLAGMTALQGLRDVLAVKLENSREAPRERVLVVGASGGVGHVAVQLARAAGCHVVAVCSGKNAAWVSALGAHEIIDYQAENPYAGHAPFDVIYDAIGGAPGPWVARLTPNGRYGSATPGPGTVFRSLLNPLSARQVHPIFLKSRTADLQRLGAYFSAGQLRCEVDSRFPLSELSAAWDRSRSGRARGKIVIEVGGDSG